MQTVQILKKSVHSNTKTIDWWIYRAALQGDVYVATSHLSQNARTWNLATDYVNIGRAVFEKKLNNKYKYIHIIYNIYSYFPKRAHEAATHFD